MPQKRSELIDTKHSIDDIKRLDDKYRSNLEDKFVFAPALSRKLVSFQANKQLPVYRWYKYKEAFSAELVKYLLGKYRVSSGQLLDPFAGVGTALFAAGELGFSGTGIELLPIGQEIIKTRLLLESNSVQLDISRLEFWLQHRPWNTTELHTNISVLRITEGAYPPAARCTIERYLGALDGEKETVKAILRFALLCILESVSYTRKDGQYLRWDSRSERGYGSKGFDKGKILDFDDAISAKLKEMLSDITGSGDSRDLFAQSKKSSPIRLISGSCLNEMPNLPQGSFDAIMTSPPYCNRYDYTRTYALELAILGVDEENLKKLRQAMVSCTVENREKDLLKLNPAWQRPISAADQEELLQTILKFLEQQKDLGLLNNDGIARMVRGYFYEMSCVIFECARVLRKDGYFFMVNDNVRYAGASISVDMILSRIAEKVGFSVENILVLPQGKGNSSQQMGEHGREPLRKCVYVWRKL